jgi:iron complex transport system substrate-binding protein
LNVAKLPSVGGFADTSLEAILALEPDLVVAYQGNSLELVGNLRKAGVTVLAFKEATTLSEIGAQMQTLLAVAGSTAEPESAALEKWNERLSALSAVNYRNNAKAPSVFFGYPGDTAYTAGQDTFVSDLLLRGGLRNVVDSGSERWPQVSAEFIIAADPDWIVMGTSCTADEDASAKRSQVIGELQSDRLWKLLPAVQAGRVIVLDADILVRPGPRILDALAELKRQAGS